MTAPASFGRYRVVRELGSGAMGQVFLATDPDSFRMVAVKLLKNPLQSLEARFRREFRLLQKLEHPGVVRVFEFGQDERGSYLVMEFIQGQEWGRWQGEPPGTPDAVLRVVRVAQAVAGALEYVHRAGIIHRDLKPENILVTEDGVTKITDFGLARGTDASVAITQAGKGGFLGTLLYAPPEQIQGRSLDHRADLYAFGMVLYRLLTGRTAFEHGDIGQVVLGHLRQKPRPPRELNPVIPEDLERLLLQLLEKNPVDRPDSAATVQALLASFDTITTGESLSLAHLPEPEPDDTPRLLEPPFLGREALLGGVLEAAGRSPAVLLEGDAGIGKTRLLRELLRERATLGWRALEATPSPGLGLPFEALTQWLRAALARINSQRSNVTDPAQVRRIERAIETEGPVLANLVPEIGAAALPLSGEQAQFTLFASALRFLRQTSDRPLNLVLENLERADDGSLGFVAYALRGLSQELVQVRESLTDDLALLTLTLVARTDSVSDRGRDLLQALEQEGWLERISIPALRDDDTAHLVRAMLGGPCDEALVSHILERSRGNPWMAGETLRGLIEAGQLSKRRRYWEWTRLEAGLSESLREALEARFAKLKPDAQDLAAVAAIIGEALEFDPLLALSGQPEDDVLDDLDDLIRAKILLEERRGRTEIYRFASPLLRDAALERLSSRKRRRLHERYAQTLESKSAEPALLAHHWAQAGDGVRAAEFALEAARKAEAVFALAEAEPYLRQALAAFEGEHPLKARLDLQLGKIAALTGRSEEAEERLKRALETGGARLEGEARLALAELYQRLSRWPEAIALLETDLGPSTPPGAWLALVSCLRFSGRINEALERAAQAEAVLPPEPGWQSVLAQQRAASNTSLGRLEDAYAFALEAVALAERTRNPISTARALTSLGRIEHEIKRSDDALEHFEQARAAFMRAGDLRGIVATEINTATVLSDSGEFQTAADKLAEALEVAERGRYRDLTAYIQFNLAEAHYKSGQFANALAHAETAVQSFSGLSNEAMLMRSFTMLARVQLLSSLDPMPTIQAAELLADETERVVPVTLVQAWWYMYAHQTAAAVDLLMPLHMHYPQNPELSVVLVEALRATGRLDEARSLLSGLPLDAEWGAVITVLEVILDSGRLHASLLEPVRHRGHWEWVRYLGALGLVPRV